MFIMYIINIFTKVSLQKIIKGNILYIIIGEIIPNYIFIITIFQGCF